MRIKLINLFIIALCKIRTAFFSKLATSFDAEAKTLFCLLRIQRFIVKYALCENMIARLIFKLLPVLPPYKLTIDRTNWKFGSFDTNIFMLGIVYQGVAYPLLFSMSDKRRIHVLSKDILH